VKTPKRVDLAVLLKILSGSAELVKVRQTLSRVGDSFDIPNGLLLDVDNGSNSIYLTKKWVFVFKNVESNNQYFFLKL
jgi:hypothetical protein